MKPEFGDEENISPLDPPENPSWDNVTQSPAHIPDPIYACTGLQVGTLKRLNQPHPIEFHVERTGTTTDASGRWVSGYCEDCGKVMVWEAR